MVWIMVVPGSFRKLLRVYNLHLNIVNCAPAVPDIYVQTDAFRICVGLDLLLQLGILYAVNLQIREYSLKQLLAQLRILHDLPK